MSYTQEQIDRANQVNLEQFLRSQGEELFKSGREYRWKNHDSLTVKGNKWFRHSHNKGGYPKQHKEHHRHRALKHQGEQNHKPYSAEPIGKQQPDIGFLSAFFITLKLSALFPLA